MHLWIAQVHRLFKLNTLNNFSYWYNYYLRIRLPVIHVQGRRLDDPVRTLSRLAALRLRKSGHERRVLSMREMSTAPSRFRDSVRRRRGGKRQKALRNVVAGRSTAPTRRYGVRLEGHARKAYVQNHTEARLRTDGHFQNRTPLERHRVSDCFISINQLNRLEEN